MWLATSLALVESNQWRRTSTFLSQIRVNLEIRIDNLELSEAEVRMLAMAKGPPTAFGRIVGRLPLRMVEEHAQSRKVVRIHMLLLLAEWHEGGSRGIVPPGGVALLSLGRRSPMAILVPPDREPRFQERAGDTEHRSGGARQQFRQPLVLIGAQVVWATQEEGTVEPQVLAHLADLVPITPGLRGGASGGADPTASIAWASVAGSGRGSCSQRRTVS